MERTLGLLSFNRVVRQRQGKGEHLFEYATVLKEFDYDYNDSERPAIQVNQVLRNGQIINFFYNMFGNLLFQQEYIWQKGMRRLVQWRYRYNRDGALGGTISPEGNVTQYYYGRDDYLEGLRNQGRGCRQAQPFDFTGAHGIWQPAGCGPPRQALQFYANESESGNMGGLLSKHSGYS